MIEIAALWKNTSQKGEDYLSGNLGRGRLLVLKNNYKDKENHPDYKVYLVENKPNETSGQTEQEKEDGIPF